MGNTPPSVCREGKGHPEVFYRGMKAAQEGRFTVSELYFVRALTKHPGQHFWAALAKALSQKIYTVGSEGGDTSLSKGDAPRASDAGSCGALEPGSAAPPAQSVLDGGAAADRDHLADGGDVRIDEEPDKLPCSGDKGDDSCSAEQPDKQTDGTLSAYSTSVVDIDLPLDGDLHHVMDYFRLLADIAHTYLELISSTVNVEKVTGLAARYCLLTISHTQSLLHCLTLWKAANLGDGGGFIDYDKKRNLQLSLDPEGGEHAEAGPDWGDVAGGKQRWRSMDRTAALLVTLALLEARCRFFLLSFLANYCGLLLRSYRCFTEQRKLNRIHANVLEHLHTAYRVALDFAGEYPHEYLSALITAHVPALENFDRDYVSSTAASSHVSDQNFLSLANDRHRHLYASGAPWGPTQSALIPLMLARNVRLNVQRDVSSHMQAQLRSPAERMSYHYTRWNFDTGLEVVPGCSLFMLMKSLPGFVPGKSTFAHLAVMAEQQGSRSPAWRAGPQAQGGDASAPAAEDGGAERRGSRHNSVTAEGSAAAKKREAHLKKCEALLIKKRRYINTDLHLCDERTCVAVCLEETCALVAVAMLYMFALRRVSGESVDGELFHHTKALVTGVYGPDSSEWNIMESILHEYLEG